LLFDSYSFIIYNYNAFNRGDYMIFEGQQRLPALSNFSMIKKFLKTDIKYISVTLNKMEQVFEQNTRLQSDQKNTYRRLEKIEVCVSNLETRITNVEKWKMQVVAIASAVATLVWFVLNKLL